MKKIDRYFYPAVFTYEPGQEIAVVFPDLVLPVEPMTMMLFCLQENY